jgi:hypothetical protein
MTVLYNELNFTYSRELNLMQELLQIYNQNNLTPLAHKYFGGIERVGFNPNSGCVWLEDDDNNCLMINGDKLDLHIYTPYNGIEGFLDDILNEYDLDALHREDKEYLLSLKENQ